jgi:hypothetical protein
MRRSQVPYVVVVGVAPSVVAACRYAAAIGASALTEPCSVETLATTCATWRPIAIVVPQDVYDFDSAEFDALARDAGAQVVTLPPYQVPDAELRAWLVERLRVAAQRREGR